MGYVSIAGGLTRTKDAMRARTEARLADFIGQNTQFWVLNL